VEATPHSLIGAPESDSASLPRVKPGPRHADDSRRSAVAES